MDTWDGTASTRGPDGISSLPGRGRLCRSNARDEPIGTRMNF
jgi:hypothetical protein